MCRDDVDKKNIYNECYKSMFMFINILLLLMIAITFFKKASDKDNSSN